MTSKQKKLPPATGRVRSLRHLAEQIEEDEGGKPFYATDELESEFGKRLEFQRTAKSLTQEQLASLTKQADETGKGLSRSAISLYELGINRPGVRELRILCEVLRISPSYFIYGEEDPFGKSASAIHFGGIADTEPEFMAKAVYCLYHLDSEHSVPMVQMMIGMLKSEISNFESRMNRQANDLLIELSNDLKALLEEKNPKKD